MYVDALLSGEADTITRVKVRELRAVLLPTLFSCRGVKSRLICFVSIFCNLGKSYTISLLRGIDDVYRLIEKIKRREENHYIAPCGCGRLKKMLLSEFFSLDVWHEKKGEMLKSFPTDSLRC